MVAPLIGLLGAAALSPVYRNYNQEMQGRRNRRQAEKHGVDLNTASPQELANFGFQSGMMGLEDVVGVQERQRSFDENVRQFGMNYGQKQQQIDFNQNMQTIKLLHNGDGTMIGGDGQTVDFMAAGSALSALESGGRYNEVGKTIDNPKSKVFGQQALGKYQMMEGNALRWAKEATGVEYTREEFLANPAVQEATFEYKFGEYVNKYGLREAIVKWHAGEGISYEDIMDGALNDGNMSTLNYVNQIERNYVREASKREEQRFVNNLAKMDTNLHREYISPATTDNRRAQIKQNVQAQQGAQDQANFAAPQAAFTAQEEYRATTQPQFDKIERTEQALTVLDNAGPDLFDRNLTPDEAVAVDYLNQEIMQMQNEFFREIMMRDDAPGEEEARKIAENAYPMVEKGLWDTRAVARVKANFGRRINQAGIAIMDAQGVLERQGISVPELEGRGGIPGRYEVVQ